MKIKLFYTSLLVLLISGFSYGQSFPTNNINDLGTQVLTQANIGGFATNVIDYTFPQTFSGSTTNKGCLIRVEVPGRYFPYLVGQNANHQDDRVLQITNTGLTGTIIWNAYDENFNLIGSVSSASLGLITFPRQTGYFYLFASRTASTDDFESSDWTCTTKISEVGLNSVLAFNAKITNNSICDPTATTGNGSIQIDPSYSGLTPAQVGFCTVKWTSNVAGFVSQTTFTSFGSNSFKNNLKAGEYTCFFKNYITNSVIAAKIFTIKDEYVAQTEPLFKFPSCTKFDVEFKNKPSLLMKEDFNGNTASNYTLINDASAQFSGTLRTIRLVPDDFNKNGALKINYTPAVPANFEAKIDFMMGEKFEDTNTTNTGADGFSFNYGPESTLSGNKEDGVTSGLAIRLKNFDVDKVYVYWNNVQLVVKDIRLEIAQWMTARVRINAGKLTVTVGDNVILNDYQITAYSVPTNSIVFFAGRTGGKANFIELDNFELGDLDYTYSLDGTTFGTTNTFTNQDIPTNGIIDYWVKQGTCSAKYSYDTNLVLPSGIVSGTTVACDPTFVTLPAIDYNNNYKGITTFETKFTDGKNYTIGAGAKQLTTGIELTADRKENKGYIILGKPKTNVKFYSIDFSHKTLNKSGADGFSFSIGDPTPIVNQTNNYEDGLSTGLVIRFKTFNQDTMEVLYNGTALTNALNPTLNFENTSLNNFKVEIFRNATTNNPNLRVSLNGTAIFLSPALPNSYATDDFSNFSYVIAARTGGSSNLNRITYFKTTDLTQVEFAVTSGNYVSFSGTTDLQVPMTPADVVASQVKVKYRIKNSCEISGSLTVGATLSPATPTATSPQTISVNTYYSDIPATYAPGTTVVYYLSATGPAVGNNFIDPNNSTFPFNLYVAQKINGCESPKKLIVINSSLLSTNNFELSSKLSIYPNPTKNLVTLALNGIDFTKVSLFDLNGRTIQTVNANSNKTTLDLSGLTSGIYLAKLETADGTAIQKIVKE